MVKREKYRYKAKRGAFFSDKKAQIYGECFEGIMEKKGGNIHPIDVVNAAENIQSPLHDYFVWDDELAGAKYRIWQARHLTSQVVKVTVTATGKEIEQRAFLNVSVVSEEGDEPVYVTTERALTDDEFRGQILAKAMKEIEYWKQKYVDFTELIPIFEAKEKVEEAMRMEEFVKDQQKREWNTRVGTFKEVPSST